MHGPGFISIWFFIGVLLTAYGVIITATGLYELASPPANPPVLANLHPSVWWGRRSAGKLGCVTLFASFLSGLKERDAHLG